jgi:hypothetical protein
MDQTPPDGSPDLLTLCEDETNIDPKVWIEYANKFPPKPGNKTGAEGMGLLPFRVWQLYDEMVNAIKVKKDQVAFMVAAGALAHYVGDACQPLHISYFHHGDPDNPVTKSVTHQTGKHKGETDEVNLSAGVHEDYEQTMFRNDTGGEVQDQLTSALKNARQGKLVTSGREAAAATVKLMRSTFNTVQPKDICSAYDDALKSEMAKADILAMLWKKFGNRTVNVMEGGCKLLALLWASAWEQGGGDKVFKADLKACAQGDLAALYNKKSTCSSYLLTQIGSHLSK